MPGPAAESPRPSITAHLRGVRVYDADRTLLDIPQLDLDSPRIAVVGPNGSGKSTLLRLLNGLNRADEGEVELRMEGQTPIEVGQETARARSVVGFVFSDPLAQLLLPTPLEDVKLSLGRLRGEAKAAAAMTWLSRLQADCLADQSVYELSSGERQRVALASVLAAEPRLLVLDEPTTLLDRSNVRRLESLLSALEIPVIMATHDLDAAARFPRAIAVEGGRVVDDGPGPQVVASYIRRVDAVPLV